MIAYPGETTRLRAAFDIAGRYVYHCHILDHEDNEMMRPFDVQSCPPRTVAAGQPATSTATSASAPGSAWTSQIRRFAVAPP